MYSSKIYFTVPNLVEIYSWKFKLSYNKCNPFPTTNVVHFSLPPQFITKVTWRRLTLKREIFSYRISYISNILALKTFDGWSKPFHILCVWQRAGITINKSLVWTNWDWMNAIQVSTVHFHKTHEAVNFWKML